MKTKKTDDSPLLTEDLGGGMIAITDPRFAGPDPAQSIFDVARSCGWKLAILLLATQTFNAISRATEEDRLKHR